MVHRLEGWRGSRVDVAREGGLVDEAASIGEILVDGGLDLAGLGSGVEVLGWLEKGIVPGSVAGFTGMA